MKCLDCLFRDRFDVEIHTNVCRALGLWSGCVNFLDSSDQPHFSTYSSPMRSVALFILAGVFEIGGGYLVWLWLREHGSAKLGIFGFLILALYGIIPVFQPPEHPFGRIYAAYGAVFIILSVSWEWVINKRVPDLRDWLGAGICLVGALVMMWPRQIR